MVGGCPLHNSAIKLFREALKDDHFVLRQVLQNQSHGVGFEHLLAQGGGNRRRRIVGGDQLRKFHWSNCK
jgi:hypothetical protein